MRLGWIPALGIVAALVASVSDARFLYVALMLVFVVYPMVMTFGWLSIVSRPSVIHRQRPQSWLLGADGSIGITYYDAEKNAVGSEIIEPGEVGSVDNGKEYITLHLLPAPSAGVIIIPAALAPEGLTDSFDQNIE